MDFELLGSLALRNFDRKSCLRVTVNDDEIYEADIEFFEIDLDIINQPDGSNVTVDPIRTIVGITDNERKLIFALYKDS